MRRLGGKIRKIKDLTERREREIREPFPTGEIFDLTWPFRYRCRSEGERTFLVRRVRNYAFNGRRGSFKLPLRFRDLQAEVSKFTKSKLREMLYRVKPSLAAECRALRSTFDFANRVLTRCMWRVPGNVTEDCARRVDTHRLASRDWPRNPRSLWPSSPSLTEVIVMSRSGKVPDRMWKPPRLALDQPTVRDLSANLGLATRIVSQNIVGVRSTVSIPRKFLPWFRYRSGILFLTVRYSIPAGLVRLLLSVWKKDPYSLWLHVKCRLKYYLRLTESWVKNTTSRSSPDHRISDPCDLTAEGGKAPRLKVHRVKPHAPQPRLTCQP
jgi:hypothetical protein